MATATRYPNRLDPRQQQAPAAQQQDPFEMEERLDPKHIKFLDGEIFTGVLTGIDRITINGKPAARYRAEELETGEVVTFNGTYQIDSKLKFSDIGRVIELRCEGSDPSVGRNGNQMKIFKVRVSKGTAPGWANDGTPITDNDLPPFDDKDVPQQTRR